MKKLILALLFIATSAISMAQNAGFQIALLKYNGGGDWYANKETSLPNLIKFCNQNIKTNISPEQAIVDVGSPEIFSYPFLHMTGHGNVEFSPTEVENLTKYLRAGGFLHIDDNYGMDPYIRREIKKLFPDSELVELPDNHPIYHQKFKFSQGLPKIHEHDNKAPQGFGIFYKGRLVLYYTVECDLGDGWENPEIHKDSQDTHVKALQMGANILQYVFTN